jgi:hypothetical protein
VTISHQPAGDSCRTVDSCRVTGAVNMG